jgi:hypothetical protein
MDIVAKRGRADGEAHAAAITRVVALAPQREEILAALDRVTCSTAFQSSKRAQTFLRYIVEYALSGEADRLKERSIGSAVFGREPSYDTGTDSIVRVTANEVRKRLAAYYTQPTPGESVTFGLPAGSYIPEILIETADSHATDSAVAGAPPRELRPFRWRAAAIASWLLTLVLAILCAWLASSKNATVQTSALRYLPWVALFDGGQTPQLIMADSAMGALRTMALFPASLEDYAYRRFVSPPPTLMPDLHFAWRALALKEFTSLADARIAAEFSPLAVAAGRKPVIRTARELQLSDFRRGDNWILLGSNASNPWVDLFQSELDFQIQFGPGRGSTVRIRNPKPHDPPDFASNVVTNVTSGTTGEAYAALALVTGLDGRGRVLIAQGTNMEGTELAAEMALNTARLSAELRRCGIDPTDPAARFEILLRLSTTAGSTRNSEVLATRNHPQGRVSTSGGKVSR